VQTIPTAEVVPGDMLIIEEGDTIATDARVLEAIALRLSSEKVLSRPTRAGNYPA
jgi:Ca2+-transporting ATPase